MKKYFFTAAALLIAASCTRELPETAAIQNENLVPFTIENANGPVIAPEDGSRTQLGNLTGSVVNWTAGDNALLFDNISGCKGHKFTGTPQSDATKINFAGEVDETSTEYWVLYPYNSGASKSGSVISTTLSATQTAVAGSFADKTAISFAHGTRTPGQEVVDGLSFSNLCSVIAITIPTYVDNAKSVVITSNSGTAMAGNISFNTDGSLNSVSGSSSVTLSGTLSAGATYFAVVAPREYANGFTLTLTTAGNNTYSASTTKAIDAQPGMIYPLGTLGFKLSNPVMNVDIQHTTDANGNLNGTAADLRIKVNNQDIPAELVAMATWDIVLKNSDNVIVRRYDGPNGTMAKANGYDYLPQGTYTVSGTYTTLDGKVRTLTSNTATSPAPTFSVSVSGYTSYDCYKGTNGQTASVSNANAKDGSTVYGLGASVTISADLMNDSKYSKSFTYSYDQGAGVSISGNATSIPNKTAQSWNKHTLSASCTFDGKKVDSETRNLHVTGLPFYCPVPTSAMWDTKDNGTGEVRFDNDGVYMRSTGLNAFATTKTGFYCPEGIGGKISADMRLYAISSLSQIQITVSLGSITCARQDSEASLFKAKTVYKSTSKTGTINNGNKIQIKAYAGATGPNATIYNINAVYN